ncbi:MAG: hypothetical protein JXA13_01245 [Anaerolineales bacterium]|nr:hypothetical protein [Anaerolineales bacterium]
MKKLTDTGLASLWLVMLVILLLAGCSMPFLSPGPAAETPPGAAETQSLDLSPTPGTPAGDLPTTVAAAPTSGTSAPETETSTAGIPTAATTPSPTATPEVTTTATLEAVVTSTPTSNIVYALVNVPDKGVLSIRGGPGTDYIRVGGLEPNQIGIKLTGRIAGEKPRNWYEIQRSETATGWITSYYVIEYVESEAFCKDERVEELIESLEKSITDEDGRLLRKLVSPMHGVTIRLWRDGVPINILWYAPGLYLSDYPIQWGYDPGSYHGNYGAFSEEVYPELKDVFSSKYDLYCNDASKIDNTDDAWLPQYENINYYTVYRPETTTGAGDWRAWMVGVDYVDGKPSLFALIHFSGD